MPDTSFLESLTLPVSFKAETGGMMRWHELALQNWLYRTFTISDGYPVPVVFTAPMDAFSNFANLWKSANNPFKYLLDLKDHDGFPLYEPHPSPARYPIISVHRRGWNYRPSQNFSQKRWRRISWPTVNSGVSKQDLGNVVTSRMPAAWDFIFQIDHFCLHAGTQSRFVTELVDKMWRAGGVPQVWVKVNYPGNFGKKFIRAYLDGNPESVTPEEPAEGEIVIHRTSFFLVLEGYVPDINYEVFPALWKMALNAEIPGTLDQLDAMFSREFDLRIPDSGGNPILDSRDNVPYSSVPLYGTEIVTSGTQNDSKSFEDV